MITQSALFIIYKYYVFFSNIFNNCSIYILNNNEMIICIIQNKCLFLSDDEGGKFSTSTLDN